MRCVSLLMVGACGVKSARKALAHYDRPIEIFKGLGGGMLRILTSYMFVAVLAVVANSADAAKPFCGDQNCSNKETAASCPSDCGSVGVCGDGVCGSLESCSDCETDCGVCPPPPPSGGCNNNGVCNTGEDCVSCPSDCQGKLDGKKSARFCCGDTGANGSSCTASEVCLSTQCGVQACGDGSLDFLDGEECDDGNVVSGDGCSAFCTLEPEPMCGDGQQDTGEQCDDGNLIDGDGCSAQCEIELPVCGNGLVEAGEQCDDGNTNNGDGCDASCLIENTGAIVPAFQFNVGDSIGEAQSADGVLGSINHRSVWSTGYDNGDIVTTLNERFESSNPEAYLENNSVRDPTFNKAISGSTMADFASQAQRVREEVATLGASGPGQVTVLLGGNDVCAPSMDTMTPLNVFEEQFRQGLMQLAEDATLQQSKIHVSAIPAIYWLWASHAEDWWGWCSTFIWPFVPCQNLVDAAASGNFGDDFQEQWVSDDCASSASRNNPDVVNPDDGANCQRRKEFHRRIRDDYNPRLEAVVDEYRAQGLLPNAQYVDIFEARFEQRHTSSGDCFHPSLEGQALLAREEYCRSELGQGDATCE